MRFEQLKSLVLWEPEIDRYRVNPYTRKNIQDKEGHMVAKLSWIDHDSQAKDRTLKILAMFQDREKETIDELGLGSIRDSFADQLFPGTSTLHTRLRYALIVPWIYRTLEKLRIPSSSFAAKADKQERNLIKILGESSDAKGTIGKEAGTKIKRIPSEAYWSLLGSWGIRKTQLSRDTYHRTIDEWYKQIDIYDKKLEEEPLFPTQNWHTALPNPPEGFPKNTTFSLTRNEAEFIRDCIQETHGDSFLAYLTFNRIADLSSKYPWEIPDHSTLRPGHRRLLYHARMFSTVMYGAGLTYNYQLAKKGNRQDVVGKANEHFEKWNSMLLNLDIDAWPDEELFEIAECMGHHIPFQTKQFVQEWIAIVRKDGVNCKESEEAIRLIINREMALKGPRSRFSNERSLRQWGGNSGTLQLNYRWPIVKQLLFDLFQGLDEK